jgi:N-methylhydantoinase A/oxoprolinase/acetone carboxylase beta subunit
MRVAVDTGGTFTDVVTETGEIAKIPSTPDDPSRAVRAGVAPLTPRPDQLAHGTTVATNALLERRGGRVALVTTEGFADVIEIARQVRPSLYDPFVDRVAPLVPRSLRFEVGGRLDGGGRELAPLQLDGLDALPADLDAVAVCLLHADLDGGHEQTVAASLRARGLDVSCSHEVSPEFREYERTVTTVVDAYLRPRCREYLRSLAGLAPEVLVMTSAGGLVPAVEVAAERPVLLLVSGPAGGVRAAAALATACGFVDAVSFDMGGTSTDVCLVRGGIPEPAPIHEVAGLPVRVPGLDVHTIGAGGGSIARIDPGGALVVGPQSAGADPGPACYGRGGEHPTVTDADLVLGRIPGGPPFAGLGRLDPEAARAALARAGVDAAGVVAVVDVAMERAVRAVTVARGVDPRAVALVAFGGAGPLHACAVADALGMPAVIVPPRAGVFSAVGLLGAPVQRDLVRSWPTPRDHRGLADHRARLEREVLGLVGADPHAVVESALDVRYAGQSHELTVPSLDAFAAEHARRNGYAIADGVLEVTAVRARARVESGRAPTDLPPTARAECSGPAVVAEPDCTVWIPPGWRATPGPAGAWVLRRTGEP